jgi:hypothetical protein
MNDQYIYLHNRMINTFIYTIEWSIHLLTQSNDQYIYLHNRMINTFIYTIEWSH